MTMLGKRAMAMPATVRAVADDLLPDRLGDVRRCGPPRIRPLMPQVARPGWAARARSEFVYLAPSRERSPHSAFALVNVVVCGGCRAADGALSIPGRRRP